MKCRTKMMRIYGLRDWAWARNAHSIIEIGPAQKYECGLPSPPNNAVQQFAVQMSWSSFKCGSNVRPPWTVSNALQPNRKSRFFLAPAQSHSSRT